MPRWRSTIFGQHRIGEQLRREVVPAHQAFVGWRTCSRRRPAIATRAHQVPGGSASGAARQREAAPGEFDRRDRGRRRLRLGLAGERIGVRRHQIADARRRGVAIAPVDRREDRAAPLAVADHDLEDAGAVRGADAAKPPWRARSASASAGCTSTNGSGRCAPSVGLRPGARHGVPLVAQPAGVEAQRKFARWSPRAARAAPAR